MRTVNQSPKQNILWFFIAGIIAIALSAFIIFSLFKKDDSKENNNDIFLSLIEQSSVLQNGFQNLQLLNEKYANALAGNDLNAAKMKMLDSLNLLVGNEQKNFARLMDSVQADASSYNQNSFDLFNRIIQSYRSALRQSNALNAIRNSASIQNINYAGEDSSALLQMQMRLQNREMENMALNQQLTETKDKAELNSPDNFKKYLTQKDTVLNNLLEEQKQRNENLVGYNTRLEKENQGLKNQLQELRNVPTSTPNNTAPAKDVERMNADINLGKVDCYLMRADARQIISNANQRKDLLQNALTILNTLSQSNDSYVQQQVQTKMAQLKRIAADNHD